jgi:hypothetical protein
MDRNIGTLKIFCNPLLQISAQCYIATKSTVPSPSTISDAQKGEKRMPDTQEDRIQYRVPATTADMLPPKPSSLIAEAASFLRAHWDEVKPLYEVLSGERESVHGSQKLDDAHAVFEMKRIALADGYAVLGTVSTAKLRVAFRFGYLRNTGVAMHLLEKQYKQLQLEHRQRSE